jgi:hypothetical protein
MVSAVGGGGGRGDRRECRRGDRRECRRGDRRGCPCGGGLAIARREARDPALERTDLHVTLLAGGLDLREERTQNVDRRQEGGGDVRCVDQRAVAQALEQVLARMRDRLEPTEAQEPAGALQRVQDPEDVVEDGAITRSVFEGDEVEVEPVEHFARLDEEVAHDALHLVVHRVRRVHRSIPDRTFIGEI